MKVTDLLEGMKRLTDAARVRAVFEKIDAACLGYSNLEILEAVATLMRSVVYEAKERDPGIYADSRAAVIAVCHAMGDYVAAMPERVEDLDGWLADKRTSQVPEEVSRGN